MLKFTEFLFLFLVLISCIEIDAQEQADFDLFQNICTQNIAKKKYVQPASFKSVNNELDLSLNVLYLIYKNYFSSQDGNKCSFHPSCSDYSVVCIEKHGIFKGGILSFDRLMRCNGLSPEKYQIDVKRRKFIDHVE